MSMNSEPIDKSLSSFQIVKGAVFSTNKHFIGLISDISFMLLLSICIFVPFWIWYAQLLGAEHPIVSIFKMMMNLSLFVVILFMLSLCLFNRINPSSQKLTVWGFTKQVTWPWFVEGIKAAAITVLAFFCFIIPGIIKYIHYVFFSFVVFFNKDYKEGRISSLKHSKRLSKGLRWWLLGIYVVAPSVVYCIGELFSKVVFSQVHSVWLLYPSLILSVYITYLVFTYIYSVLFFMYAIKDRKRMVKSPEVVIR